MPATPPWRSEMHWRRDSQQSRSAKTQNALLDAAEVLFAEKGGDATSVADIAAKAGCSVGAVYHHFRDKTALSYALYERMAEEFQDATRQAIDPARWEGAPVSSILKGFLKFSLEMERERPAFKGGGLEATRHDPKLQEHYAGLQAKLHRGLKKLILERKSEIGHPNPEFATGFVLDLIVAMLRTRSDGVLKDVQMARASDAAFLREAMRAVTSYLSLNAKN